VRADEIVNHLPIRRVFATTTLAGLGLCLAASTAIAALVLVLDRDSGAPGIRVTGQTGGNGVFATQVDPLSTYLVSQTAADQVTSPNDPHLIKIGRLVIDAAGNGRITFVVPQVDPGSYVVMVQCPSCAQFSAIRTMLPVADFRVTASPPATDTEPSRPAPGNLRWAVIGAGVLWAAVVLMTLRRRLRTE
jgi:hypothetical protein